MKKNLKTCYFRDVGPTLFFLTRKRCEREKIFVEFTGIEKYRVLNKIMEHFKGNMSIFFSNA